MAFENPAPPNELRTITCRARALSVRISLVLVHVPVSVRRFPAVHGRGEDLVDITEQRETEEAAHAQVANGRADEDVQQDGVPGEDGGIELPETGRGLLFVIDMDRFKQVNDEYGHSMGDRVLEEVARSLLDVFRRRDPVGRVGGDEFVAFLVGANDDAVIEAKREALSSLIAEASRSLGVPIALSVGVARYPQDGATYQELFDAADRAMYDEKNEGRVEDSV